MGCSLQVVTKGLPETLAPSITSFSDAERYAHISVRLQVEIMSRASAYIGYRRIRIDTNDFDDLTLDRSAHLGLIISF